MICVQINQSFLALLTFSCENEKLSESIKLHTTSEMNSVLLIKVNYTYLVDQLYMIKYTMLHFTLT